MKRRKRKKERKKRINLDKIENYHSSNVHLYIFHNYFQMYFLHNLNIVQLNHNFGKIQNNDNLQIYHFCNFELKRNLLYQYKFHLDQDISTHYNDSHIFRFQDIFLFISFWDQKNSNKEKRKRNLGYYYNMRYKKKYHFHCMFYIMDCNL